ncbi:MAG: ComEC/Rec2 family competence protein [Jatrophihabitantaceae bacterium]
MNLRGLPPGGPVRSGDIDLRLGLGALAAWLATLVERSHAPCSALVAACIAGAIGVLALAAAHRGRRGAAAAALVGFCVALVLFPLAGRMAHNRASPLVQLAEHRTAVTVVLTVGADPRPLAAKGVAGSPRVAVETSAESVRVARHRLRVDGRVLVLASGQGWRDVLPGQRVRLDGQLGPSLDPGSMSVSMFVRSDPVLIGSPPWWQRGAGAVRSSLRRAAAGLPADERGLLPGLVDGDTANLDPVLAEHFRLAGLTHLVAVSGTNCSILIGTVLLVLRRFAVRPWICAAAGAGVLLIFVTVARPSPSVLRAALMAGVALISLSTGRPQQAIPALSAVVLVLLLWDPELASNAGFAMSVLATGSLLVLAPPWAEALRRRRVPAGVAESVAVAAAAHVVTAPVIAALSGRVSLVAIPANVLAEPVVAVTTVLGFAAAVVSPMWLAPATLLAHLAAWPCRWLVWVANFFGGLHGATVPWPGGMAGGLTLSALATGLLVLALHARPRRALAAAAVTAVVVLIPVRSIASDWPAPGWIFVACDVGQGDALVLAAGPHSAVVIDAGPDPVAVDRCLHDLAVTHLPLLIFSHDHLDHVGGISGIFHGRDVGRVFTGPLAEPASGLHMVQAALAPHELRASTPVVGQSFDVGRIHLDVLSPVVAFHGTRSDPNNSSLVLRATIDGTRLLLSGDAEIDAQRSLLDSGVDLRADVLKVPHHGSAYSDPAFLAAVHARVGVISVGQHNDYGHPSPMLLTQLARLGVPVRRTDRDGDVAVVSQHGSISTVVRGVRASTVGLGASAAPTRWSAPARAPARLAGPVSGGNARMGSCPAAPSASTICPLSCPASCCSPATRNCLSLAPSARSPPPLTARIRRWSSLSEPVPRSTVLSSTNWSAHRCSAMPGSSSSGRPRTSRWLRSRSCVPTSRRRPKEPPSSCTTSGERRARNCSIARARLELSKSAARSSPGPRNASTSCAPRCAGRARR